jgi:hypothetical protein
MFVKLVNNGGGVHHVNMSHVVDVFQVDGVVEVSLVTGRILMFPKDQLPKLMETMEKT